MSLFVFISPVLCAREKEKILTSNLSDLLTLKYNIVQIYWVKATVNNITHLHICFVNNIFFLKNDLHP